MYNQCPIFPHDLDPPAARSLSLLFVLHEFLNCFKKSHARLSKLSFYSEALLKAFKMQDESLLLQIDEIQNVRKQEAKSEKLSSFFSSLIPFLQESKTDENILLFLVEKAKEFNAYLGPRTIENLLQEFFPAGPHELRAMICEGYTRRGFHAFYRAQEPMLDALEWES